MIGIYFSGTGNTKFCTEYFLGSVSPSAIAYSIEDSKAIEGIANNDEIIFGYPVYYSNLPKYVSDFISTNSDLWNEKKIFVIATMALFSGDGAGVAARLFEKYGAEITGGLHIEMPDCIADVKVLKRTYEKNRAIVKKAKKKITISAQKYKSGKPTREGLNFGYRMAGFLGQRLYFMNKTKSYTDKLKINPANCIGCGKCANVCPMNNIDVIGRKAVPKNLCTMCYRCVNVCPKKAITLIGKRVIEQHDIKKYIT